MLSVVRPPSRLGREGLDGGYIEMTKLFLLDRGGLSASPEVSSVRIEVCRSRASIGRIRCAERASTGAAG